MEQKIHPEEIQLKATDTEINGQEQTHEGSGSDRRSFLTRAALGVAGAAGLAALGAQTVQAEAGNVSVKNKILARVKMQMEAQDRSLDDAIENPGLYSKNSHSLYLKE